MDDAMDSFMEHMKKNGVFIAARLQAAITLLERVRTFRTLDLSEHKDPGSTGLKSHESFAKRALERFQITGVNRNSGRRSNNIGAWGAPLLELLSTEGFEALSVDEQDDLLGRAQHHLAMRIREIAETAPIMVHIEGRSAESVIRDVLEQGDARSKSGDIAQYLVAAKLELRLGIELPLHPANKGDRKGFDDTSARTGDFEIEDATLEIAIGPPDGKHLAQIEDTIQETTRQVWLLTRHSHLHKWQQMLGGLKKVDDKRIVVSSVESFIGQNVSEIAAFSASRTAGTLQQLFDLYNNRWVAALGTPAMLIQIKQS